MTANPTEHAPVTTLWDIAEAWLRGLTAGLESGAGLDRLFAPRCHWRDAAAFTRDLRTFSGARVPVELAARQRETKSSGFRIAANRTPPRLVERNGVECVEVIIDFDMAVGTGTALARLVLLPDGGWRARTFFTAVEELAAHPWRVGHNRPLGQADATKFGGPNWLDRRRHSLAYTDREPDVLVVGGGQSGLALAARLGRLGVDTLVVDTHERPGDNWRKRYHALTLHNAVWLNDLPYMPFPPSWPVFVPKDKLAGWFEAYADAMEINFWGATTFEHADYNADSGAWTARVRRGDGEVRTLRPRHVVLATGVSGIPHIPRLDGIDSFDGEVLHSSAYRDAFRYRGRNVIVVGTGNSAHDIAQDLHANGTAVTMVQRNPTTVISVDPSAAAADRAYLTAPTLEDSDLIGLATPYPDFLDACRELTARMAEFDRELIASLNAVGFRTDYGHDGSGQQMKYMRKGGGYYLDVGCSALIASRRIGLVQLADTAGFTADGLRMADGGVLPADAVILATGFKGQQESVRALMGDAVADAVGPVWGYDDEGELRNMWRPTGQPGLWFSAGNFQMCRTYSKILALQLRRALDEG